MNILSWRGKGGKKNRFVVFAGERREGLQFQMMKLSHLKQSGRMPNHQRWYARWKLSWNMYTMHTRFCTFRADLYAQSVLTNKISASELSPKFINKSALLVGFNKGKRAN